MRLLTFDLEIRLDGEVMEEWSLRSRIGVNHLQQFAYQNAALGQSAPLSTIDILQTFLGIPTSTTLFLLSKDADSAFAVSPGGILFLNDILLSDGSLDVRVIGAGVVRGFGGGTLVNTEEGPIEGEGYGFSPYGGDSGQYGDP